MFRRHFFPLLASVAILLSTAVFTFAQSGELRGHVTMKKADGVAAPVADAVIDVYRVDIPAKFTTKTNKKGLFVYAGLPYTGDYIIVASSPGAQAYWQPGVKAGRDVDYMVELQPGDGKRLTIDEIKTLMASRGTTTAAPGARESGEDKAKRAELEKKNAEIAASNEKILKSNEIVARTYKAGNDAYLAKNYDEAIKQYEEGLAADPEQPALLVNEARAYTSRGVDRYNASITAATDAAKASGIENAKNDFKSAATSASKAVAMIKAQTQPTDPGELTRYNNNKLAALAVAAEAYRLFVSKADNTQADAGLAAFKEYIAVEPDAARKAKAQLDAAQMLLDAGSVEKSFIEYKAIVTAEPDNADANLGAGLSLFATGDKTKFQDAANYLQHYVDVAPDTHKFKADAKAILAELKNTEKVVPTTTPSRRRGRP
jgi:tetratricopeptide (TPR) repeat protein